MKIDFSDDSKIPELKTLWAQCFSDPMPFIDGFFEAGYSPRRCRCLTEQGRVAAALYWFDMEYRGQKMAYLYGVATAPKYRGQGLCRRLMGNTHDLLHSQGYTAALLLPGEPELRQMYGKLGYRDHCELREFSCQPGQAVPLEEISWQAYAARRSGFLPENGATQDGLGFLATYAHFYRGDGFLLAAAREGGHLLGLKLLGKTEAAPGILTALGCEKGSFRTPGRGKKTVMALSLQAGTVLPGYVGLTFD